MYVRQQQRMHRIVVIGKCEDMERGLVHLFETTFDPNTLVLAYGVCV